MFNIKFVLPKSFAHFFDKNFVKAFLKKALEIFSSFHEIFFGDRWLISRFSTALRTTYSKFLNWLEKVMIYNQIDFLKVPMYLAHASAEVFCKKFSKPWSTEENYRPTKTKSGKGLLIKQNYKWKQIGYKNVLYC